MNTKSLKMKKVGSFLSTTIAISLIFLYSCNTTDTVINGNWTRSPDYGGSTRSGAFQFTIGDTVYVGLGFGGKNNNQYLLDAYKFSLQTGYWKQIANFPGKGRELSVSFSVNNKGYVGTGLNKLEIDQDSIQYKDFWQYDPTTNVWTRLNDFPGNARYGAVSFASNTNGYVGAGYDGDYYDDFYKYDPLTDQWTEIPQSIASKRVGAMVMKINDTFYYFGGQSNGLYNADFYSFDYATEVWTNRSKISTDANYNDFVAAVKRGYGSTMTLSVNETQLGYVVCGAIGGSPSVITYQYDPTQDLWTKMTSFEGGSRFQGVSFVLTDIELGVTTTRGFVGTGTNGSTHLDDVWEWKPTQTYDPNN